ncbi:MAG TPA: hypothetical protein PKH09_03315 [Parvularculaceae bacterium]|nr:hypothetical protein [Parvularculaceae bacterium]
MAFPVIKAFKTTFAYLQSRAVELLKALWLPVALLVALQIYAAPPFFDAMIKILELGPEPDPAEAGAHLGAFMKWGGFLVLGSALLMPMATVASLRHIVRGDDLGGFFYFQYGGDELRVLAGYLLFSLMLMLITIVGGLGAAAITLIFALAGPAASTMAKGLGELIINLVTFWFRLRLCVLFPAAIATRTIGFGVSWEATKGNVLRLAAFWILMGLVLIPASLILLAPFAGDFFPLFEQIVAAGEDEEAARAALIPLLQRMSDLMSVENPQIFLLAPALAASTFLSTAIANVASGAAWRLLTDHAAPAGDAHSSAMAA